MSSFKQLGISYLRYTNLCGIHTRSVLREPFRTQALERGSAHLKVEEWKDGNPTDVKTRKYRQNRRKKLIKHIAVPNAEEIGKTEAAH